MLLILSSVKRRDSAVLWVWKPRSWRFGGEPFTDINREMVAKSPFVHTLFSGYSHGNFGYIPSRNAYAEGGYEVEASPFSADAPAVIAEECISVLKELAADK
jgi:hypothetical protein